MFFGVLILVIIGSGDICVSCVICEGPGVGAGVTDANGLWCGVGGAVMCGWGLITCRQFYNRSDMSLSALNKMGIDRLYRNGEPSPPGGDTGPG